MITFLTESKSQVIELSERALITFCSDISSMLGVDMECSRQEFGNENIKDFKEYFGDLVAVTTVKAEGILKGNFQLVFDQQGIFILSGVINMLPEQMIWENIKLGTLEKAKDMSNVFTEVGIAMVGAWDRVFRKELDGYGSFTYIDTFIGNLWDKTEKKINLPGNEEFVLVPYQMTIGSYPSFKCGIIFPKAFFPDLSATVSEQTDFAESKEDSKIIEEAAEQVIEDDNTKEPPEQEGKVTMDEKNDDVAEEVNALADTDDNEAHPVSQAIRKMAESPAASAGEPITLEERSGHDAVDAILAIYAKDIMRKEIVWGSPDDNVEQTIAKMQQYGTGYVMIGRDKIPQGIVSKSDLTALLSPYLRPEFAKWRKPSDDASLKIRIKWIMSSPVNTINLETLLPEIMEIMCQYSQRAMPVVDQQGKVQGLVTVFEIFKGIIKHFYHK